MGVPAGITERRAAALAGAALALLVLALTITPITNNDLFLHLKTGAIILDTGRVPHADDYSALARGRPFIAHEWLSGVLFRLVEAALGPGGRGLDALILLKALVALAVAGCLVAAARRLGAAPAVALAGVAFVMLLAAARFLERPHIVSYLLTAVFLWLLARRRAGAGGSIGSFLPLQILWANLHGGFLLGPALLALAAAGAALDGLAARLDRNRLREAARLASGSILLAGACLLNPYGTLLLRFPFELTGSSFMGAIYEWLPPFGSAFSTTYMFRYYVAWIGLGGAALLASLAAALRRRRAPPGGAFPFLVFAFFLALSLRMNRNVTDFALATVPGVAAAATWAAPVRAVPGGGGPARAPRSLLALALLLLGLAGWFVGEGYPFSPSSRRPFGLGLGANIPVAGADYLRENGVRGNAFNTYAYGAYLVYRFYPEVRVAMDSRNDVYGEALYAEYLRAQADRGALEAMLRRLDASFIFLEWARQGPATPALVRRIEGWRLVYFDDETVIYLPEGRGRDALIERDGYRLLDPALYRPGALEPGQATLALQEADRAIRGGGGYVARVMRIEALLNLGRTTEALAEDAAILRERPPLQHIYMFLGLIRLRLGDRQAAADRFRITLEMNPASEAARWGLRQAGGAPPPPRASPQ